MPVSNFALTTASRLQNAPPWRELEQVACSLPLERDCIVAARRDQYRTRPCPHCWSSVSVGRPRDELVAIAEGLLTTQHRGGQTWIVDTWLRHEVNLTRDEVVAWSTTAALGILEAIMAGKR
jgi:hypothetical protein